MFSPAPLTESDNRHSKNVYQYGFNFFHLLLLLNINEHFSPICVYWDINILNVIHLLTASVIPYQPVRIKVAQIAFLFNLSDIL